MWMGIALRSGRDRLGCGNGLSLFVYWGEDEAKQRNGAREEEKGTGRGREIKGEGEEYEQIKKEKEDKTRQIRTAAVYLWCEGTPNGEICFLPSNPSRRLITRLSLLANGQLMMWWFTHTHTHTHTHTFCSSIRTTSNPAVIMMY